MLGLILASVLAACAAPIRHDATEGVRLPQAPAGPREDTPSALRDIRDRRLPEPLIDPARMPERHPPRGGAPAVDEPRFQRAGDVDWLAGAEAVLAVKVAYEVRGYPVQIMLWHEVVNDTIAGTPVAVTYCSVCNTGLVFDRRATGRVLSFAAADRPYAGTLVLYDRQTESLWPQLAERAALGTLTGTRLTSYRATIVAWRDFRATYRDAWVLSRGTGFDLPYGRNPYPGHDHPAGPPPRGAGAADRRLPPMTRVVGILGLSATLVRSVVASSGVQPLEVGDLHLVAWHRPGQSSALDAATVAGGRDIGTVAVFDADVDGRVLHFRPDSDGFVDAETGTWWTVLGYAVHGALAGRRLIPYPFLDTFWYAWVAFHPGTQLAL